MKTIKLCKTCKEPVKENSGKIMCEGCLSAIEVINKGISHCPEKRAVKGLNKIHDQGFGFVDRLMFFSRK